jgi:outer membrane biosynthesis protein TonB
MSNRQNPFPQRYLVFAAKWQADELMRLRLNSTGCVNLKHLLFPATIGMKNAAERSNQGVGSWKLRQNQYPAEALDMGRIEVADLTTS